MSLCCSNMSYLVSSEVVTVFRQQVGHFLHVHGIVERRGVTDLPFIRRNLGVKNVSVISGEQIHMEHIIHCCV